VLGAVDAAINASVNCQMNAEVVLNSAAADMLMIRGLCLTSSDTAESLPNGWHWTEGCNVFTAMSGNGEPAAEANGDVLFLKVADFNRNAEEMNLTVAETRFMARANPAVRLFAPGTVVFPKRGATIFLNKVGILAYRTALDPNLMGLVPNERAINHEFLYWAVKSIGLWRLADTTSLPQLNHKHLNPLRIPLPPMDEQRQIVSQLGRLQHAISGFSARRASLRAMKAALIEREFGRETL
jgi:type I restriction enzyme, S subunit